MLQEKSCPLILGGGPGVRFSGGRSGGRGGQAGEWCPTTVPPEGGLGPKMRHLVLYKLAGFPTADKVS